MPITPPERKDDDILEELRDRRDYGQKAWEKPRDEGRKDVMCVVGDVWQAMDPDGLKQRQASFRPAVSLDEIGQYLNQTGNDVRQNKRGVKVTPTGNGANDKTAEYRQARIRQIEYESNAQRDVYSPIFEDALQRSYGFGRIVSKHVSDTSRKMKLLLEAFPNPDVCLVDPDGAMLSPDCAKIQWAFVLDASRKRKQFRREFPDAQVTDFDAAEKVAPDWIKGDNITLAEYWTIDYVARRVVFLKSQPDKGVFVEDLSGPLVDGSIDDERMVDVPFVGQYLTNGVELLAKKGRPKRTPWPGPSIPIFSCFGKVLYVNTGTGTERRMLSMVRLMRAPVMANAYATSCEIEILGSVPRATYLGYKGQFRGVENNWQKANHEPVPYLEANPYTEATGTGEPLPLPVRQSWDPPLQNIEMARESFRRSIQSAAGTSPLPTEAQRKNQKSGVALDRIESSGQKGSFHHVDHLDGMITRVGVMLNELIPHYDDTMGDVTIRKPDDQSASQRINDPNDPESVDVSGDHQHDVTLSVGPAKESERQASSEFADTIVGNEGLVQIIGPQKAAELTALAIRLKDVGPIGDEMADIIAPKPQEPGAPPTPEMLQQQQQQAEVLSQENQQLKQAIATDEAKQRAQVEIAKAKALADAHKVRVDAANAVHLQQMKDATSITVAKINALTKGVVSANEAEVEALALAHDAEQAEHNRAHDVALEAMSHAHALEAGAVAHEQGLESGAAGSELVMQQAEHAAEIAPEPAGA